jgi:hypothetical protein
MEPFLLPVAGPPFPAWPLRKFTTHPPQFYCRWKHDPHTDLSHRDSASRWKSSVAGSYLAPGSIASAEIFDPVSGSFP